MFVWKIFVDVKDRKKCSSESNLSLKYHESQVYDFDKKPDDQKNHFVQF